MTSPEKVAANRRNAMRSTGPRTATGKARSRCNAIRHGLSLSLSADDSFAAPVEELTEKLTAFAMEPRQGVRVLAEAQLEVARVRQARIEAINRSIRQQSSGADDGLSEEAQRSLAIFEIMPTLTAFDRYERRALSRRRKAMRALESYQRTDHPKRANPAGSPLKSINTDRFSYKHKQKEERIDARNAAKVLRLHAITANCFTRLSWCHANLIRKPGRNSYEKCQKVLSEFAAVAQQFILLNKPDVALDTINTVLNVEPDHLMLHAVRACALLITGNHEARAVLLRHRGRVANGKPWRVIILDLLRRLRKAPGMQDKILREVERRFEPEPLSTLILKRPYIEKATQVAIQFILTRELKNALEAIELALPEMRRSVDLNVVHAHALMFLDRTEEARALYEEFWDLLNYMARPGIKIVVNHFEMMRAAGLTHPLMDEIQSWSEYRDALSQFG